ncbi:VanZ family protein [Proteinivorax hydrogeniformans]|uniref:VanZ family protein n=1 Tax=Proteinivorax hydrogeniformans TaxID=1826727 RepID=A0AAU8HSM2_9FIRM
MLIGVLGLTIFIVIDVVRNKSKNIIGRLVFYNFLIYLLKVFEVTTGNIHIPPRQGLGGGVDIQLIPFRFIADWYQLYVHRGADWFFWNSVRLSLYNVILLLPLGIYLPALFNVRNIKRVTIWVMLTSLTIEIYQAIFSYYGLVFMRTSNIDDIILNTLGGVIGFGFYKIALSKWIHKFIAG